MQSNQLAINNTKVIDKIIFANIDNLINNKSYKKFENYLYDILNQYNIDIDTIIKEYCNYIIRLDIDTINNEKLKKIEYIIHNIDINQDYKLNQLYYSFSNIAES